TQQTSSQPRPANPPPTKTPTCAADPQEPNDKREQAKVLPAITDCDSAQASVSGIISSDYDFDYYTYQGSDTVADLKGPCVASPSAQLDKPGFFLAVNVTCKSGAATLLGCSAGSTKESL